MKCKCGDYKSYGSTMMIGVVCSPSMPLDACVNCIPEFNNDRFKEAMERVNKLRNRKK